MGEWHDHPYGLTAHLYGSLYFTITGFHMAHVVVGLIVLLLLLLWTALGYFDERRCAALTIGGLYWHFVDVVWLFIFTHAVSDAVSVSGVVMARDHETAGSVVSADAIRAGWAPASRRSPGWCRPWSPRRLPRKAAIRQRAAVCADRAVGTSGARRGQRACVSSRA